MRSFIAVLVSAAVLLPVGASGGPLDPNPWLERRVLNMAHQGGEIEAPSNTLYAFETALAKGADVLELDVHATADGEIVVIHDATVDRTTNGSGRVDAMTLEEIKSLDAAYWFVPDEGTRHGRPNDDYTLRGIATGDVAPPDGFEPNDFTIPTLREVLERYPDTFINIEIKNTAPGTTPYEAGLASLLAEFGRTDDTIVVSFLDHATELFKVHAPDVHTATGTAETAVFKTSTTEAAPGAPNPRYQALQVPITFNGIEVVNEDFVVDAHSNGLAVHVWTINSRDEMCWLISIGVDGIMTDRPTVLEDVLRNGCVG